MCLHSFFPESSVFPILISHYHTHTHTHKYKHIRMSLYIIYVCIYVFTSSSIHFLNLKTKQSSLTPHTILATAPVCSRFLRQFLIIMVNLQFFHSLLNLLQTVSVPITSLKVFLGSMTSTMLDPTVKFQSLSV